MKAIFRCDATAGIGFGHLSRCMALAEGLRAFGTSSIFAGAFDPGARDQLDAAGFARVDLDGPVATDRADRQFSDLATCEAPDFLVLDSYRVDEGRLADLAPFAGATIVIDDFKALEVYPCDVVLNFTWSASSLAYPPGPRLLLGPEYFLVRRALVALRPRSLEHVRASVVRNLLVAIGGADPKRLAARVASILRVGHPDLCLRVVAANAADAADMVAGFAPGSLVLPRQPDLAEALLWADAAVTGGGLIKYESGFMGVPAAALSQNAGQAGETQTLAQAGLVFDLGLADERSDADLARDVERFLADAALREGLAARMRESFPPDPPANAARAIVEAIGR